VLEHTNSNPKFAKMASSSTMRVVIFKAPGQVAVKDRPIPKIKESTDVIIKVKAAALCGSDLHFCRGQMKVTPGFIVGY
jgi:threonine dehydrogenase-like Zn-dependent dehydrogenase